MSGINSSALNCADREITATRIFDAPRELTWKVWTDPSHIAQWWGPRGFTNTIHKMEVRPGGVWEFMMHGPNGVDYPNKVTYLEVKAPELLVYDHGEKGELTYFRVTVTFEDLAGKTKLTMQMLFETAQQRNQVVEKYGAVKGLKQNMDKLGEYLAKRR
jgi:uncharacterized protein YndB with AHSA1/START domain